MAILFDISARFEGCRDGGLQKLEIIAGGLYELREKLKMLAAEQGGQFLSIYIFHDIRLHNE